ncbi:MAG: hypothetical protein ACQETJ_05270 [Bacteroidota bacterium]
MILCEAKNHAWFKNDASSDAFLRSLISNGGVQGNKSEVAGLHFDSEAFTPGQNLLNHLPNTEAHLQNHQIGLNFGAKAEIFFQDGIWWHNFSNFSNFGLCRFLPPRDKCFYLIR